MPTVEHLASQGLRYNQFHTTALCSPTRTALLSGRNHHMNNMGGITEVATSFPGSTGQRPNNVAPLAEMLRLNGYSTGFFGKNHETAAWEVSPSGPTDRWPTRSGFDKFYGFIGGENNQWTPLLYDGLSQIETPKDPNYHFMTDMTNQAIGWMRYQKALTPAKPRAKLIDDQWELYDTHKDFSLTQDLASTNPQKLKEVQDIFLQEAIKNRVLPIDDRNIERLNAKLAGRPDLMDGRTSLTVYPGMKGMSDKTTVHQ